MHNQSQIESFNGLRVAAFESRKAEDMRKLIRRFGGEPLVAPSMQEVPLEDQQEVFKFGQRLAEQTVDVILLLTGVGTRTLIDALSTRYSKDAVLEAFAATTIIVRGPKPIVALVEYGLKPTITVPEPNTWKDIITTIDQQHHLKGKRLAVQEYGSSNAHLLEALRLRFAEVIVVPVYRWALPDDLAPLKEAIKAICDHKIEVMLFTSAIQVDHLMQVADSMQLSGVLLGAIKRCVVASIGPICSEALKNHGVHVDIEPLHPKMGSLLAESGRKAGTLLKAKRKLSG